MDEPGLDIEDELIESGDEEDFLWPPPDKINDAPWMPFDIDIVSSWLYTSITVGTWNEAAP